MVWKDVLPFLTSLTQCNHKHLLLDYLASQPIEFEKLVWENQHHQFSNKMNNQDSLIVCQKDLKQD